MDSYQPSSNACMKCDHPLTEKVDNCHNFIATSSEHFQAQKVSKPSDRHELTKCRVIQRNLVYLIGLPPSIADEETMIEEKYFGQYGHIRKCAVKKTSPYISPLGISYSAFITYNTEIEATLCIKACDGFKIEGRRLKATFGTSKYCNSYIKGQKCLNADCLYLHELGSQIDTFTKEDIQRNKHIQPHNSIFPLLSVVVSKTDSNHVLPVASLLQRKRVFSDDIHSIKAEKPRLYNFDTPSKRQFSRFGFDEESMEEPTEAPKFLKEILAKNSPAKDIAHIYVSDIPELMSHSWAKDLLDIKIPEIYTSSLQDEDKAIASPRSAW
ncbi:unnamed protein product [Blepharisma stoltei]|uniref:RRM domain-containing protein n=1 Tax=Blepharisma stoltei TaxID=1481888 RepID=A0AAU9ILD0_9CILI|nr:unnamed protein product [Blepharisma stoltei]